MKLKLWLRRHSISAPRMTIRTDLPWPLKIVFIGMALGLGAAVAMWAYDMGRGITGPRYHDNPREVAALKEQIEKLSLERDHYSAGVNSAESRFNIERSTQKQLAAQIKLLETENARLKEDLAFFESLLPAQTGSRGIAIRRIKAEIVAPNQLKYRLLVMQGGKGEHEFVGSLQLVVTVVQAGKSAMIIFPDGKSADANSFKLAFKHYQRLEGVLMLPDGVTAKTVQARILEKGQIRAQQSANL